MPNREDWMGLGNGRTGAFEALKQQIAKDVTLLIPQEEGQFCVEADSSDYANGGCSIPAEWRQMVASNI